MSIVKDLSSTTLNRIKDELGLIEERVDGQDYMTLNSPMSPHPVGNARVFKGKDGEKMVYIGITVPPIQLDSHMIFCFSDKESLIPHFTLDAVHAGPHYAFHLDLLPKVDPSANLSYVREVFEPLTEAFTNAGKIEGLSPAHLSPTQLAIMSSWMVANRATEEAMDQVGILCSQYLDHWLSLKKNGIKSQDTLGTDLAKRDQLHRSILFSPEVDPVWDRITKMIGEEASEKLQSLLLS